MARRLGVQVACRRAVVGHFLILFDSEVVSGRVTTEVRPVAGLELFELAVLTERHGWGGGSLPSSQLVAECHVSHSRPSPGLYLNARFRTDKQ